MTENGSGGRRRRRYSAEFKADLVARCKQPGVSIASLALANGMNANVLRRWLVEDRQGPAIASESGSAMQSVGTPGKEPAFVPVKVDGQMTASASDIRIEMRRAAATVTVNWPIAAAAECASWMRELLK